MIFAVSMFLLSSCGGGSGTEKKATNETQKKTKEEIKKLIETNEKAVFDVPPEDINESKAKFLAGFYIEYAAFKDSLAPEYLYKAAGIFMNSGEPKKAIKALNEVINDYPDYDKVENCYFLRAYVYDDKLKDYNNARKYYDTYLEKYPNGDFAPDAKMLRDNLGKSTEEVFEEIEKDK
jgi:tetratricopeptide (TPR) repeat protein